jgi:hypothetical protein
MVGGRPLADAPYCEKHFLNSLSVGGIVGLYYIVVFISDYCLINIVAGRGGEPI